MTGRAAGLESLLSHVADKPVPLARLARLLLAKGQHNQARQLCARAVAMAPDDAECASLRPRSLATRYPVGIGLMLQDRARNMAYDAALRRAIRPGCRVLEIGTGSGLLAMMAARAGAAQVVTCECNAAIADVASEIIAGNGLADRVRIVAKHSADLAVGVDLDEPVDVLVSEIVTNNMVGEGVLPAIEQAARRLIRPDAQIIPARGIVRVALAEDRELASSTDRDGRRFRSVAVQSVGGSLLPDFGRERTADAAQQAGRSVPLRFSVGWTVSGSNSGRASVCFGRHCKWYCPVEFVSRWMRMGGMKIGRPWAPVRHGPSCSILCSGRSRWRRATN